MLTPKQLKLFKFIKKYKKNNEGTRHISNARQ